MPLPQIVILAVIEGLAETLPISGSAHGAVAALWLDPTSQSSVPVALLQLGAALGLAIATRHKLASVLRAFAHPEHFGTSPDARDAAVLTVGAGVSLMVSLLVTPRVELWGEPPFATGIGLLVTGIALASTLFVQARGDASHAHRAPPNVHRAPSLATAALVGLAHGLAVFPGASRIGAALTVLLWLRVVPARAVELAFVLTVPSLLLRFAQGALRASPAVAIDAGTIALGLLFASLSAILASGLLRRLAERRRVGVLALWIIPLGLAMLAYARALPSAGA